MANNPNAALLEKKFNAAITKALKADPNVNGRVYVSYNNPDLGIKVNNLPVQA